MIADNISLPNPNYPQRFDNSVNPENRYTELCRWLAIALGIASFLILVMSAGVYYAKKYQNSNAVIIVRSNDASAWRIQSGGMIKKTGMFGTVAGWFSKAPESEAVKNTKRNIQEFVAKDFTRRWFWVSSATPANEAMWKTCVLDKCGDVGENIQGELCCLTTQDVFSKFMNQEVPKYRKMSEQQFAQRVETDENGNPIVNLNPIEPVSFEGAGTLWKLEFVIEDIEILPDDTQLITNRIPAIAFVRVENDGRVYPKNMGAFVSEFNYFIDNSNTVSPIAGESASTTAQAGRGAN